MNGRRSGAGAARLAAFRCLVGLPLAAALANSAAVLEENFGDQPGARGWQTFGDASLFVWNDAEQHLAITWDSSRSNSYFYRRLPAVLSQSDDFALGFELTLAEVLVGVTPGKPFAFQLAVGFINLADAAQTNFLRGSGVNPATGPRNVVEFNYFPDSGFGATISPTIISSNNQFASSFSFPLELDIGPRFRVSMRYTAADRTLRTSLSRDGQPFGPVKDVILGVDFSDFRVDAVSMSSFSDRGADGSIRVQGVVDNVMVETPEPPVTRIAGTFLGDVWRASFATRTGWTYTLEVSEDLRTWIATSGSASGTGRVLTLEDAGQDLNSPAQHRFYRVRAERP